MKSPLLEFPALGELSLNRGAGTAGPRDQTKAHQKNKYTDLFFLKKTLGRGRIGSCKGRGH